MHRSAWIVLAWILTAAPALGDEPQDLVREACADLVAHLPSVWPGHVGRGADAEVFVHGVENRSRARAVDLDALNRLARETLDASPRLRAADAGAPLLVVGGVYGSGGTLWAGVVLCDVGRQVVLGVGLSHQPAPEAAAALVAELEAQAQRGWPEGLPLAPSGKPVLTVDRIDNRTRWRDLDTEALSLGLCAALLRAGVVELGVGRRDDAMRAIQEVRDWQATELRDPATVEAVRVGLTARGTLEGRDPVELSLAVLSTVDGQPLARVQVEVPHAAPTPAATPSPSPTGRRSTGRGRRPRGDGAGPGRRSPGATPAPEAAAAGASASPLRPRPSPALEVSSALFEATRQIESGACQQAIATCEALLKHDDPYLEGPLHLLLGDARLAQGEPDQAIERYTHVLERTPFPLTEAYAGRARARLALARAQPEAAAELAQAALDDAAAALAQRFSDEGLHLRAEAHAALGDDASARVDDRLALAELERDDDPEYDDPDEEEPAWVQAARARTGIARGDAPEPAEPRASPGYFLARRSAVTVSRGGREVALSVGHTWYHARTAWLVLFSADAQPDPVSEKPTVVPPGETCAVVMLRQEWEPGAREARPLDAASFQSAFAGRPDPLPEQAVVVVLTNEGADPVPVDELLDPERWDWSSVAGSGRVRVDANVHSPTGYPEMHLAVRLDVTLPDGGTLRGAASVHLRSK